MFRYYDLLSNLSTDEIDNLSRDMENGLLHPKEVKKGLARELTARYHSSDAALKAEANFEKVFKHHGLPEDIPVHTVKNAQHGIWLPRLMQDAGLVQSTSEARRLIKQQAVSLDGERISDKDYTVMPDSEVLLKVGKRRFCRVCFE